MDPKTNKLLQQAGKYVLLGKLSLALEEYLKLHELEPEDTTIVNTIADLYCRMEARDEALTWYQKLGETFECRQLPANAIAVYRKVLKLAPKKQEIMERLARLYERQGQPANARLQYKIMANQWLSVGDYPKALDFLNRVCNLQPDCPENWLDFGQALEKISMASESCQAYLKAAELWAKQGNLTNATSVVDRILRLRPKDKEFAQALFNLLYGMGLAERGMDYLHSISLDEDPEFKAMLGEVFLQDGNLPAAQKFLLNNVRGNPKAYPATMRMLQQLIQNGDLAASLEVVEAVFETSLQQHDEAALKMSLNSILKLDPMNVRTLKIYSNLMIRTNDRRIVEETLKQLVVLHLESGDLREARDSLNKLVVYGQNSDYLDFLNDLNEVVLNNSTHRIREVCQNIIRTMEGAVREPEEDRSATGVALGVSELDLGMCLEIPLEAELFGETAQDA